MTDFRPFSTPSPLLVFPSASPSAKLRCTPTKKAPLPVDWAEECHELMLLDANHVNQHSFSTDNECEFEDEFENEKIPPASAIPMMMINNLEGHSTSDYISLHTHSQVYPPPFANNPAASHFDALTSPIAISTSSLTRRVSSSSTHSTSSSSSSSVISSLTSSSASSYISSISSKSDSDYHYHHHDTGHDMPSILQKRRQRQRHVSMICERSQMTYNNNHRRNTVIPGSSWYSSSASVVSSVPTTIREQRYHDRFAKKKSRFGLLVAKMKRAAERPFRIVEQRSNNLSHQGNRSPSQ